MHVVDITKKKSDYFLIQHLLVDVIHEEECGFYAVRTKFLCKIRVNLNLQRVKTFVWK